MKSKEFLFDLLKDVTYPGFTRDIISFGIVKDLSIEDKKVTIVLELPKEDQELAQKLTVGINNAFFPAAATSITVEYPGREIIRLAPFIIFDF